MPPANLKETQLSFAAYIRDPENNPPPGDVPLQRMQAYRQLFFNNVEDFLATNFPVLRTLYNDEAWTKLVQDFFSRHHSQTPYFSQIAEEFLDFLENEREAQPEDPPFLLELAHYEWIELEIFLADPPEEKQLLSSDQLLERVLALAPSSYLLAYAYPVHQISAEFQPQQPNDTPTYLIAYQDHQHNVAFMEVNATTARLIELIENNTQQQTTLQLLKTLANELAHADHQAIIHAGIETLEQLIDKRVIVGHPPEQ